MVHIKINKIDSENPASAGCQFDMIGLREKEKIIKPKDVFDYKKNCDCGDTKKQTNKQTKVPKGYHRMPDGTIMKDSEMISGAIKSTATKAKPKKPKTKPKPKPKKPKIY